MLRAIFIRSAFNYDMDEVSRETALDQTGEESLTVQSAKESCDINTIVRNFGVTKVLPQTTRVPQYADYEGIFDFQSAMNAVRAGEEAFSALPAQVRNRFENDPQKYLEFVTDPKNIDEMRKLGLAKPAPKVDNPPVDVPPKE